MITIAEYDEGMVEGRLVQDLEKAHLKQDGTTPHPPSPPPSCCCSPFSPSPQFQLACIKDWVLIPARDSFLELRVYLRPAKVHFPVPSWPNPKIDMMDDAGLISWWIFLVQRQKENVKDGLNLQELLPFSGRPLRHSKPEDVDRLPHLRKSRGDL